MQIKKYGHCCLSIEDKNTKLLVDPGIYSHFENINPTHILITHEHTDHIDLNKVLNLFLKKQNLVCYTTQAVKNLLIKNNINENNIIVLSQNDADKTLKINDSIQIRYEINPHLYIMSIAGQPEVISFILNNQFLFTSDTIPNFGWNCENIAFPICAPFLDMEDIEEKYIKKFQGENILPIHDGFLTEQNPFISITNNLTQKYNKSIIGSLTI